MLYRWQSFLLQSSNSKVNKSISELWSSYNTSCLVNSHLLNHQNGNGIKKEKSVCRRSGKEVCLYIYLRKRGCCMKGWSWRLMQQQQQQRESVFTQACVCETRCLHQRGTLTAACHIQAPEELLLGVCVCVCVCVFSPLCDSFTCWCKSHFKCMES